MIYYCYTFHGLYTYLLLCYTYRLNIDIHGYIKYVLHHAIRESKETAIKSHCVNVAIQCSFGPICHL